MTTAAEPRPAVVAVLIALALGVRLAYVLAYPQVSLQADALDYDRLARSVVAGEGLVDELGEPETLRPPLYPLIVAGVYRFGTPEPQLVRVFQAVLGAAVPLVVLWLGRGRFGSRVALAAAATCAVYPALIAYTGMLLTETCASLLLSCAVLSAVHAMHRRTLGWFALTGVVLGLLALCRAELVVVAAALTLVIMFSSAAAPKRRLLAASMLLGALALTLLPWSLRNYRALGAFVPLTTDGWRTLWIASYPERWLEWKAAEPVLSIEAGAHGPLDRSRRFRAAALENLRTQPQVYLLMTLRRIPLLLVGGHSNIIVGLEQSTAVSSGPRLVAKLALLGLNTVVIATAAAGLWLCRRRWACLLPLYVAILAPAVVYVLLFAVPRYHIPMLPLAFLFAAEAVLRLPPLSDGPSSPAS
jgi:4-amino-4-deoxy-L-arabinose transferase-like glycosyltransferase